MEHSHDGKRLLLFGAYHGDLELVREGLEAGADVEKSEDGTGLRALHLAVGGNHFELVRYLVEQCGARIVPDRFGRWPSVIAAACGASAELCVYLAKREPGGK